MGDSARAVSAGMSGSTPGMQDALRDDADMNLAENTQAAAQNKHPIFGLAPSRAAGFNQAAQEAAPLLLPKGTTLFMEASEVQRELGKPLDGSPSAAGISPTPELSPLCSASDSRALQVFPGPLNRKRSATSELSIHDDFQARADQPMRTEMSSKASATGSSQEPTEPRRMPLAPAGNVEQTPRNAARPALDFFKGYGWMQRSDPLWMDDQDILSDGDPMDASMDCKENVVQPLRFDGPGIVREGERYTLGDLSMAETDLEQEDEEQMSSDLESDDDVEEDAEDLGKLAFQLEERIRNNVEGRYDFEIYCDP